MLYSLRFFLFALPLLSLMGCSEDDPGTPTFSREFIFSEPTGWTVDFADYPPGDTSIFAFESAFTTLPEPLDTNLSALRISGANRSDDLFMYTKRQLTGLPANTSFLLRVEAILASDAPSNAVGIGGPPGESVYLKTGVTQEEPTTGLDDQGWLRLNIDKGNQSMLGEDALSLGNAANGTDEFSYVLLTRSTPDALTFTTDDQGRAWFYIGSDSGFEGTTTLYYHRVKLDMTPLKGE